MNTAKRLFIAAVLSAGCSAVAVPSADGLYATLQTTMGDVCFELYYTNVPRTVANFVSLAEGSRPWIDPRDGFISNEPYYNGIIFHRVIDGYMIQCGSPTGDGTDGPGYTFEDEFDPALRHDRPGIVSMANSGPDSNGGQFFITVGATAWLDDVHTVFGSVAEGMDIISNIAAVATNEFSRPLVDVTITNVFITRNGTDAQNFAVTNQLLPEVLPLPIEITRTNGVRISTETAALSCQYVYASTNLSVWTGYTDGYWTEAAGTAELEASIGSHGYFRATRVVYSTVNTNTTANPIHHQLVMTIGTDVFRITPEAAGGGTAAVNAELLANVTYWGWDPKPHYAEFYMESDYYVPFWFNLHYSAPSGGQCFGYFYDGSQWNYIGEGAFTDQDLN